MSTNVESIERQVDKQLQGAARGVTCSPPFADVKELVEKSAPLKRPTKIWPSDVSGMSWDSVAQETPSVEELQRLAEKNPAPPEFFDGDIERPW